MHNEIEFIEIFKFVWSNLIYSKPKTYGLVDVSCHLMTLVQIMQDILLNVTVLVFTKPFDLKLL